MFIVRFGGHRIGRVQFRVRMVARRTTTTKDAIKIGLISLGTTSPSTLGRFEGNTVKENKRNEMKECIDQKRGLASAVKTRQARTTHSVE